MPLNRRELLQKTGAAAGATALGGLGGLASGTIPGAGAEKAAAERGRQWWELGLTADPVLEQVLLFYLEETWQQQADVGEVLDTASRVDARDAWSWPREWEATAARLRARAEQIERRGHRLSAGQTLMRSATYCRAALHRHPDPAHPSVPRLARTAVGAFHRALRLQRLPARPVAIPYEGTTLPGYHFRAGGRYGAHRLPLLIVHEGRDGWAQDCLYLARAANDRGIDCLLFDGPGQGEVLRLQGLPLRPDWERVVTPVVDWAVGPGRADPDRIALMGISMGGALAPRAAAYERRPKLLIANPGVLDWAKLTFSQMRKLLGARTVRLLDRDPAAFDRRIAELQAKDPFLRWGVDDLMWKHGGSSPSETLQKVKAFDNTGVAQRIRARTLVLDGTADEWSQAKPLYRALRAPKDFMLFDAEDTGLLHVQAGALGVSVQRLLDWLEEQL